MKKIAYIFYLSFYFETVSCQVISTIAGNGVQGYSGDGNQATLANLNNPYGLVIDSIGNLIFCDAGNHAVRKVLVSGIISTVAGIGTAGYSGDGASAVLAQLKVPIDICIDKFGTFFIAEEQNHTIRKISNSGIISTYAGNGVGGYTGDGGLASSAQLYTPEGISINNSGNLFIAELFNNVIRKINSGTIISTIAGTGTIGYSGDGGLAAVAEFNRPSGIIADTIGNIYVSDFYNHVVRKIDTSGIISTIAGNGSPGNSGDGGPAISAQLNGPNGLVLDKYGCLYIADSYNHTIRKIDTNGIINTIAGNGTLGYSGDGGLAIAAQLNYPFKITIDTSGNLYIADTDNNVIRKVTNVVGINQPAASRQQLNIYPNPCAGSFFIAYNGRGNKLTAEIYNVYGQLIIYKTFDIADKTELKMENLPEGVYLIKLLIDGIHNKSQRIIVTK